MLEFWLQLLKMYTTEPKGMEDAPEASYSRLTVASLLLA